MYPRSFSASPAFSSASPSTAARLPAANSAASVSSFLPLFMCRVAPLAEFSTFTGRSLNQNSIPSCFSRSRSRSEISVSRNGSNLSRPSTSVTFTPNAMKIEAYSHPINSATNHRQRFRNSLHLQKRVGIKCVHIIERNFRGTMRLRSCRNQNYVPMQLSFRSIHRRSASYGDRVPICKYRLSLHILNFVLLQIFQDAPPLHLHHFPLVMHKIMDRQIFFQRIVNSIEPALPQPGKIQRRFTQRL